MIIFRFSTRREAQAATAEKAWEIMLISNKVTQLSLLNHLRILNKAIQKVTVLVYFNEIKFPRKVGKRAVS